MNLPPFRGCSRPLGQVAINPDSPQAVGLETCWLGGKLMWGQDAPPAAMQFGRTIGDPVTGEALGLHGSSTQVITLARSRLLSEPMTMAVWVQWTAQSAIVQLQNAGGTAFHQIYIRSSGTTFRPVTSGNYTAVGTIPTGTPHHLVMVSNGASYRIGYANGVSGTANTTAATDTTLTELATGIGSNNLIAEFRLYNRALSPAECRQLYAPETRWDLYAPA